MTALRTFRNTCSQDVGKLCAGFIAWAVLTGCQAELPAPSTVTNPLVDQSDSELDTRPELEGVFGSLIHEADRDVTARDGTRLSANVFYTESSEPKPVILAFTPYSVQALLPRAQFFADNGYVFVVVSARGRGDSEGEFAPFSAYDGSDAADAIAWAAEQSWSNGHVGMWGGSYVGYSQWAAAGYNPPALKTIVPAASVYPGVDYPAWGRVNLTYQFQWLAAMQGRSDWFDTAFNDEAWADATETQRREGLAFASLAPRSGTRSDIALQWLETDAEEWRRSVPTDDALSNLDIPVLSITGQFDGDQRGALAFHQRWLDAQGKAPNNGYLVIGPWDHGGTRTPRKMQSGEIIDDEAVIDLNALHLEWYDWTLKNGDRPDLLAGNLTYFVLDTGEWRGVSSIEALTNTQTYYLGESTNRVGMLNRDQTVSEFSYQLDTRMAGLANPVGFEQDAGDVRDIEELGDDGLVFESAPLDGTVDFMGMPNLSAWVSASRPDGDIFASLVTIAPDGKRTRVGYDVVRLRHRNGGETEELVKPGEFVEVKFDKFGFVARRLARGTRLQLALHSNPPRFFEMNYGGGGTVSQETSEDGGDQIITIRQTPEMPARLSLPLYRVEPSGQ